MCGGCGIINPGAEERAPGVKIKSHTILWGDNKKMAGGFLYPIPPREVNLENLQLYCQIHSIHERKSYHL